MRGLKKTSAWLEESMHGQIEPVVEDALGWMANASIVQTTRGNSARILKKLRRVDTPT